MSGGNATEGPLEAFNDSESLSGGEGGHVEAFWMVGDQNN